MYYIIAVVVIAAVVGYLVYRNNKTKVDAVAAAAVAKVKADLAKVKTDEALVAAKVKADLAAVEAKVKTGV
jgi:hypothetical protein